MQIVFIADGRSKRRPNQSWLDDCSALVADLEKHHILVTLHVVAVAQGSQFEFLFPLSDVTRGRGTFDYVSGAAGETSDPLLVHSLTDVPTSCCSVFHF